MKALLTTAMALGVFSMLEQNVEALNYKAPTFLLARGGGERGGGGGSRMESHSPAHMENRSPAQSPQTQNSGNRSRNERNFEQNGEGNRNRNFGDGGDGGDIGDWTEVGEGNGLCIDDDGNYYDC